MKLLVHIFLLTFPVFCLAQSPTSFKPDIVLQVNVRNVSQACLNRYTAVVNGSTPGPQIELTEGLTTWIRVYNDIPTENTTMHWHGINVKPSSDGSPLSQWPITPGHYFDYEVTPPAGSAGSYFYHSHAKGMQAVSVYGALIVKDASKPPYMYDDERVILIADQFNRSDADITQGLLSNPFKWSGEVSNVVVNGLSAIPNTTQGNSSCSLAKIRIDYNKTYRLRMISAAVLSFVVLGFSDHSNMSIIEADGSYTQEHSTEFLEIGGGQRYSVLWHSLYQVTVEANRAKNITKYYMQYKTLDRPEVFQSYAIFEYPDSKANSALPSYDAPPPVPPLTLPNTSTIDYPLRPLTPTPHYPKLSEVTRRVTIKVQQVVNGTVVWFQNGLAWTEAVQPTPYLIALYDNNEDALPSFDAAITHQGMDNLTRAFPAQIGEVLEIVIQNSGSLPAGGLDSHPFHAHGQHYWDIGSGNGTYDPEANEKRLEALGYQPILRDTSMLYRYGLNTTAQIDAGWRAWRIRVESPGAWLIHCHTLAHMIMGMSTAWVFGGPQDIRTLPPPNIGGFTTFGEDVSANITHLVPAQARDP
ncbi:MAG: hypothetical protein M1814_000674 [Vezdaea aestivalis]|nr:MAG: hypothetical protein M1814_000674 [Vezdaea aestivalis]